LVTSHRVGKYTKAPLTISDFILSRAPTGA
jgi:hypothetical protein